VLLSEKPLPDALPQPATAPSPRRVERTSRILAAARRLFMAHGYGGTTMEAVAREAGVGKATVYARFADKAALFAATVTEEGEPNAALLLPRETDDLPATLRGIAARLLDLLLSPTTIATHRIVAAEIARFPELGAIFFRSGPERLLDALGAFLAAAMARGQLRVAPPRIAAAQFIELIRGELGLRAMLGVPLGEVRPVLEAGVDAFLRAYAVNPGAG
jgi:AcrR family transcriptional regulator